MHLPSKKLVNESGSSLIEFAVILPILMTLFFGIIHIGIFIYDLNVITTASSMALDSRIGSLNQSIEEYEKDEIAVNTGMGVLDAGLFLTEKNIEVNNDEDMRVITVTLTCEYRTSFPFVEGLLEDAKNLHRQLVFNY